MTSKRALVTGSGKRLGRAMALYLAERGYDVAIHYASTAGGAEETVNQIKAMERKSLMLQADLLNENQVSGLVPAAADGLGGPLTLLVNNASIFEYDTIESMTPESWDRHIGSNLRAPAFLTQAFMRAAPKAKMDERQEPIAQSMVVNMIDQRVRKLTPEFFSYTLAKSALWTFTQTVAQALAPDIRVNAIAPGPTLIGERQTQEHFDRQRSRTILKRGSNSSDIVGALGYLLDAPSVTGQMLCVDGGQHLGWKTADILGMD